MTRQSSAGTRLRRCLPRPIRQRNGLALQHLGLAGLVATREQRRGKDDWDDLMQEGCLGLLRGAGRFNPQRGFKESTYLASCARGQILHYRRDRAGMIRIPWRLRDLYAAGMRLEREREQKQLPALTANQLAEALGVKPQRWLEACRCHSLIRTEQLAESDSGLSHRRHDDPQLAWLRHALRRLKRSDRLLLERHVLEGQSLRQLTRIEAIPYGTLRQRLQRLMTQLREWAQQDGFEVITPA